MKQIKILSSYEVLFEHTKIPITIYTSSSEFIGIYEVGILEVGLATSYVIEKIKEDLLREGIVKKKEYIKDYVALKKFYIRKIQELLKYYLPTISLEEREKLITFIVQKSLDLGFVDILIQDSNLEEIVINGGESFVMVYHRRYGWLKTNLSYLEDIEIRNIATRVALDNKKSFSNLHPLLDAHLRGGHRVNATLNPISTKGSTITIRRFSDKPWTVSNLISTKTSSSVSLALIWIAIENEASIIVSGGTGSGKTSFLNAISSFIPAEQRVISVEDTREIKLPQYSHWIPMEARLKNQEGKGEISMLDLIVNSLRMRPDRIVIGEIRREEEAQVLFEAMRTGHSVYGTFHANTSNETILRLSSAPINIPKVTLNALDLVVVQHRDRRTGRRRTLQIAEVDDNGEERVILQYYPREDKHEFKQAPIKLLKKLDELFGISEKEFFELLKQRATILDYLAKENIESIEDIGRVINSYYKNPEDVFSTIQRNIGGDTF